MKLEVVTLAVSDVDRAKSFYQGLGWRLDADIAVGDNFRVVQLTPPHSACSMSFGKGLTTAAPGSAQRLLLAVSTLTRRGRTSSAMARGERGIPFGRRAGSRSRSGASLLPVIRLVHGPRRQRMVAPGDRDAAPGREWED